MLLMPDDKGKPEPKESLDTHRFSLDKRVMRVRFENENEHHVDVVIEPREQVKP